MMDCKHKKTWLPDECISLYAELIYFVPFARRFTIAQKFHLMLKYAQSERNSVFHVGTK